MSDVIEYKQFDSHVVAFTTKRTLGRDRTRLCQMLCINDDHLIIPHQTHGTNIINITEQFLQLSETERKDRLEGIDAVITKLPDLCIGVSTADCIPVLLHHEQSNAIAAIHAGWKGIVERIVQKTVREMAATYGISADGIKAVIGPGISMKNFEVGDEVYDRFQASGFLLNDCAEKMLAPNLSGHSEPRWHIDLWQCNRLQLLEMGVKPENIYTERICTFDNTKILFSARREQKGAIKCGRNFNAIMLKT